MLYTYYSKFFQLPQEVAVTNLITVKEDEILQCVQGHGIVQSQNSNTDLKEYPFNYIS
jgi:hypothetical protein